MQHRDVAVPYHPFGLLLEPAEVQHVDNPDSAVTTSRTHYRIDVAPVKILLQHRRPLYVVPSKLIALNEQPLVKYCLEAFLFYPSYRLHYLRLSYLSCRCYNGYPRTVSQIFRTPHDTPFRFFPTLCLRICFFSIFFSDSENKSFLLLLIFVVFVLVNMVLQKYVFVKNN